ncbi:hypothetical protein AG1IA_04053 [Rhizoctonia solani AG-1 IA]|uniref:Uncharacterized protein n=1 Tax=Thanatephorus cucumeris (strain AG1-IA) TaxID=983506 RepID=L8WYT7_THACA|nr:hypothetical protein AG1IA_04053 [Rhizoctonia solani AG-1 IA]
MAPLGARTPFGADVRVQPSYIVIATSLQVARADKMI